MLSVLPAPPPPPPPRSALDARGRSCAVSPVRRPRVCYAPSNQHSYYSHPTSNYRSTPAAPPRPSTMAPPWTPPTASSSSSGPSSPPDLSYYDSPPPPPQSLQDQMHTAYALDDHRLARLLFLKLKGAADVCSLDDPRVAAVRDEDLTEVFAPAGLLKLEAAEEARVRACRAREERCRRERAREARMRCAERVWADSTARVRAEKRRRAEGSEFAGGARGVSAGTADTARLPASHGPQFQYAVPVMPPSRSPRAQQSLLKADARCVPFKLVATTMQGSLFPLDDAEARLYSSLSSSRSRHPRSRQVLLNSLLKVVEWEDGERRRAKGKDREEDRQLDVRVRARPMCVACSSSSSSSSSSLSTSVSWLSFGSRSSVSTAGTSVSASASVKTHSPSPSPPVSLPKSPSSSRRACPHHLTSVPLAATPLARPVPDAPAQPIDSPKPRELEKGRSEGGNIVKRVSRLLDVARGLQKAYASAVMFSVAVPGVDAREPEPEPREEAHEKEDEKAVVVVVDEKAVGGEVHAPNPRPRPRPHGYRARAADVSAFTAPPPACAQHTHTFAPYALVPLLPAPAPSRPATWRLRPIANPVLLRLKALQNCCGAKRLAWEGRAREGSLGCGRERLVGIAWEGRGRSGLRVEVRWEG